MKPFVKSSAVVFAFTGLILGANVLSTPNYPTSPYVIPGLMISGMFILVGIVFAIVGI